MACRRRTLRAAPSPSEQTLFQHGGTMPSERVQRQPLEQRDVQESTGGLGHILNGHVECSSCHISSLIGSASSFKRAAAMSAQRRASTVEDRWQGRTDWTRHRRHPTKRSCHRPRRAGAASHRVAETPQRLVARCGDLQMLAHEGFLISGGHRRRRYTALLSHVRKPASSTVRRSAARSVPNPQRRAA